MELKIVHLIGASRLKESLEIRSWHTFRLLQERGVIPMPGYVADDRHLWAVPEIPAIQERINTYERTKSAASNNALAIS